MTPESLSVLVVDDDQHTCNVFQMVMDHYNIPLTVAQDAETALTYLSQHTPDVIIMDIFLPGIDGYQALYQIRKHALAPTSTVIATTAYYTADTQKDVLAWGFSGYLPKPLNPTTLLPYLQEVLQRSKSS